MSDVDDLSSKKAMRSPVRRLGVVVLGPGSVAPREWKDTPECLTASEIGLDPGTERLCDVGREDGFQYVL
jgi:hypothetical protein